MGVLGNSPEYKHSRFGFGENVARTTWFRVVCQPHTFAAESRSQIMGVRRARGPCGRFRDRPGVRRASGLAQRGIVSASVGPARRWRQLDICSCCILAGRGFRHEGSVHSRPAKRTLRVLMERRSPSEWPGGGARFDREQALGARTCATAGRDGPKVAAEADVDDHQALWPAIVRNFPRNGRSRLRGGRGYVCGRARYVIHPCGEARLFGIGLRL